jgi:hypothetical protein|tara:strand:+ start:814 stop:1227 length:414 start_codon:yes stop_codon:yes gene_type:complete
MANETNDIKRPHGLYGDNRARVKELLDKGYRVPEITRILPISRQRIHVLAKEVSGDEYTGRVYPKMKPCQTIREGEGHYFVAYGHKEDRCPVHRMHQQMCVKCDSLYSTSGISETCPKCRRNAYAIKYYKLQREGKL